MADPDEIVREVARAVELDEQGERRCRRRGCRGERPGERPDAGDPHATGDPDVGTDESGRRRLQEGDRQAEALRRRQRRELVVLDEVDAVQGRVVEDDRPALLVAADQFGREAHVSPSRTKRPS
jgi:hypothetical protein